ncbi:SagB-type dehydrogenase domain-containing protein [Chitinispirillum alkaliphilum]|nr:SagB-type dehydrogenase domain-containing protein [Chitinispirillum alkaliphilum]
MEENGRIQLPNVDTENESCIQVVIHNRRSQRELTDKPLSLEQISKLLWASGGKTVDGITGATRAYPSAGGLYPLNFYVVANNIAGLEDGVYKYDWKGHSLKNKRLGNRMRDIKESSFSRSLMRADISVIFVITADYSVTAARYSKRGTERYVPMEAGASSQNLALKAQSMNLGSYLIGAFRDDAVISALELGEEVPLLLIPVGHK